MTNNNIILKLGYRNNTSLVSLGLLMLRCTIGVLLFIAGSGKLLGWFNGLGMEATIKGFSQIGISVFLTYLSTVTEFIGGFLLVLGLLTRPAAFAVMINMLVATIVTLPAGFMKPGGAQTPFLFLIIDIVILLAGPMKYSIDRFIAASFPENEPIDF